ncbi:MAG: hypothetical protein ACFFC7_18230 [Candidatus Hermodarchaeota archaeon]
MRKKWLIILLIGIIALAIVVPVGIIAADLIISDNSYNPADVSASVNPNVVILASDNSTFDFNLNFTLDTPVLGFLPKTILVTAQFYEQGTNIAVGNPFSSEVPLGKPVTIPVSGTVTLTPAQKQTISTGGSITFDLKGTVRIKVLGVTIPRVSYDILETDILTLP